MKQKVDLSFGRSTFFDAAGTCGTHVALSLKKMGDSLKALMHGEGRKIKGSGEKVDDNKDIL